MRTYSTVLKAFALLSSFALMAIASPLATELDVTATAIFPASNPFNNVVNGERNAMTLEIENKSPVNITLKSAAGSIHHPETGKLLKNTTAATYGVTLISGAKTILPYTFYSEHKPGEVTLKVWVNYDDGNPSNVLRAVAYDAIVAVVEPPASLIDIPLLFSYVVLALLLAGGGYLLYKNLVPKSRARKAKKQHIAKSEISAPVGPVTHTTATKSYDEDWIPAHHKKKGKKDTAVSSGDESGVERRRSPRKLAAQKSS